MQKSSKLTSSRGLANLLGGLAKPARQTVKMERNSEAVVSVVLQRDRKRLLHQAAAMRGISVHQFCVRAIMSFTYATLGMDYYKQMEGLPAVKAYLGEADPIGLQEKRGWVQGSENGRGCGKWRIQGLD